MSDYPIPEKVYEWKCDRCLTECTNLILEKHVGKCPVCGTDAVRRISKYPEGSRTHNLDQAWKEFCDANLKVQQSLKDIGQENENMRIGAQKMVVQMLVDAPDVLRLAKMAEVAALQEMGYGASRDFDPSDLLTAARAVIAKAEGAETSVRHETENNDR